MGRAPSSPLWAGYTALINEQALAGGQQTVGFLNPALYTLGKTLPIGSDTDFHDIITGNNTQFIEPNEVLRRGRIRLVHQVGERSAGIGLINALAKPHDLFIFPTHGSNTAGGVGGPFTVTSQTTLNFTNTGSGTVSWVAKRRILPRGCLFLQKHWHH